MKYRVFTKKGCGTCKSVVAIMRAKGLEFEEVDVSTDAGLYLAQKLGIMHSGAIVDANDREVPIDEIVKISVQPQMCAACAV